MFFIRTYPVTELVYSKLMNAKQEDSEDERIQ